MNNLITAVTAITEQLDLVQACMLMARLGNYDKDQFYLRGTTYQTSLAGLLRNSECLRPMGTIAIVFQGGPTQKERHIGTVITFVTDRLLRSMKEFGRDIVMQAVEYVIGWKNCDEEAERYAG